MTENEAKKIISKFCEDRIDFARGKDMSDKELEGFCKFSDALNLSISALEEIQQYRAIGTVEECQEAMERRRAKKPILDSIYKTNYYCPNCEEFLVGKVREKFPYCQYCGQYLEWSDAD